MAQNENEKLIVNILKEKSAMKQKVFDNTLKTFRMMNEVMTEMILKYNDKLKNTDKRLMLEFKERGLFQSDLKIAGDMLVFHMHSNVFEFDRDHSIWKNSYVQKDKSLSYCGIINIYNFLADSFRYERLDDLGYLIGRIFINKNNHYFVEGKRQMGFLYNDFGKIEIKKDALKKIIETAIMYALEFDLLVPPYELVKAVSVEQIQEKRKKSMLITAKRLGFQFNTDDIHGQIDYTGG